MNKGNCRTDEHYRQSVSSRMARIPRSCVREILTAASSRDLISFGGGLPHESCVPIDRVKAGFERVMSRYGARAFQYGSSEGVTQLREYIATVLMPRRGITARPDEILIVNGSQQALDMLGKVLIDPGTPVLVEAPTYLAALQAFSAYEPTYLEARLESDGPDLQECARYLPASRFFYTVPSFQNPSGVCISAAKREALAGMLTSSGSLLIEDCPYDELYYADAPPLSIAAYGVERRVVLGTFSKTFAPGFRLGWIHAKGELLKHLITVKQASDLCTGTFQQLLLYEILRDFDLHRHLQMLRNFYRARRDRMDGFLREHLGGVLSWELPAGGMFFWAQLETGLGARELLEQCVKAGVAFAEGGAFFASAPNKQYLRLNFTQCDDESMERGAALIARVVAQNSMIAA